VYFSRSFYRCCSISGIRIIRRLGGIWRPLARHELLLPREHGAYAEAVFPLLTGLTLGSTSPTAICLAAASAAFFFVHEPIAVMSGTRGRRAKETWGTKARNRFFLLVTAGVTCGLAAILLADRETRLATLAPCGCGGILLPAFLSGRLKTLLAEILVIATLSLMTLPMAVSNGVEWSMAWTAAGVWFLVFTLGTLGVHAIKARAKRTAGGEWTIIATPFAGVFTFLAGLWAARAEWLPPTVALALMLGGAIAAVLTMIPIHTRRLKTVGWTLVTANIATWVLLLLAL
jgi:hypothetical protein